MIPVLPLKEIVSMPSVRSSVYVGRKISVNSLLESDALSGEIVLLLQKDQKKENINVLEDLVQYGILAKIVSITKIENKTYKATLEGVQRIKVKDIYYEKEKNVYYAKVSKMRTKKALPDDEFFSKESIVKKAKEYLQNIDAELSNKLEIDSDDVEKVLDFYIQRFPFSSKEKQKFIEMADLKTRITYFYELIDKDKGKIKIDREIETKVQANMSEAQKAYYLREKLKVIKE